MPPLRNALLSLAYTGCFTLVGFGEEIEKVRFDIMTQRLVYFVFTSSLNKRDMVWYRDASGGSVSSQAASSHFLDSPPPSFLLSASSWSHIVFFGDCADIFSLLLSSHLQAMSLVFRFFFKPFLGRYLANRPGYCGSFLVVVLYLHDED